MNGVGKNTGQPLIVHGVDASKSSPGSAHSTTTILRPQQDLDDYPPMPEKKMTERTVRTSDSNSDSWSTKETGDSDSIGTFGSELFNVSECGSLIDVVLNVARDLVGDHFDSRMFLTGLATEPYLLVETMAEWLIQNLRDDPDQDFDSQLRQLLVDIKTVETDRDGFAELAPYSFVVRSAILLTSEKMGTGIKSWEVYTRKTPGGQLLSNAEFWPWVEKPENWIPEAQAVALKYTETSFISARHLAEYHPGKTIVAYKGGFGAGKTTHGQEEFGVDDDQKALFAGSIGPDLAKKTIRRTMPLSHDTVHLQGSNMAYNLFDGLIKLQSIGTVVYDTSLSGAAEVSALVNKTEASHKSLRIVDITRDDTARMLAVLARSPEGSDPAIPLKPLVEGAQGDRVQRPACMNVILGSSKKTLPDAQNVTIKNNTDHKTVLSHTYELYGCNEHGSDRKKIVTLRSGEPPEWAMGIRERTHRLMLQGISFNTETGSFEPLPSNELWFQHLNKVLRRPVGDLVMRLSERELLLRQHQFALRTIRFLRPADQLSPESLYSAMPLEMTQALTQQAFAESFSVLNEEDKSALLNTMYKASREDAVISYLQLPAAFALELNSRFKQTPESWKGRT